MTQNILQILVDQLYDEEIMIDPVQTQEILDCLHTGDYGDPFPLFLERMRSYPEWGSQPIFHMMYLDAERALPLLLPYFADYPHTICTYIIRIDIGNTAQLALEPVLSLLHHGESPRDRVIAALALTNIGDARVVTVLKEMMTYDTEPDGGGHSVASVAPKVIMEIEKRLAMSLGKAVQDDC
jgi:hypothetical protein